MKSLSLIAQFRSNWQIIGLIIIVSAVLVGTVLFLHFWKGVPIGNLTRDPNTVASAPLYTGFFSQIGVFLWSASAAVCIFGANALSKHPHILKIKRFLIISGILTLVLGFDDAFLLHESFFPHFGVPEETVLASYAGFVLFYLVKSYSVILNTEYILLGMALGFFGISCALDLINPQGIDPYLFEDSAKLAGIVSWLAYFFRSATFAIYHDTAQQGAPPDGNSAALHRRR